MSLLTICQDASARLGLPTISAVVAGTSDQARVLLALAKQEARELSERHNWTVLLREHTFTGTAAAAQTGGLPSDFARFADETFWNRSARRQLLGPLSDVEWQELQAQVSIVQECFRVRGTDLLITPTPSTSHTFAYEYVTEDRWGSGKPNPTADSDTCALDEALIADGLVWRWKQAKGFDYAEDHLTYQRNVMAAIHRDGGKRRLNMASDPAPLRTGKPVTGISGSYTVLA